MSGIAKTILTSALKFVQGEFDITGHISIKERNPSPFCCAQPIPLNQSTLYMYMYQVQVVPHFRIGFLDTNISFLHAILHKKSHFFSKLGSFYHESKLWTTWWTRAYMPMPVSASWYLLSLAVSRASAQVIGLHTSWEGRVWTRPTSWAWPEF